MATDRGPQKVRVLASIGDGTATAAQQNEWEEHLSRDCLRAAVDITFTLLGFQFRSTNTKYNEVGPRLLFSLHKWATATEGDAQRQATSILSAASTDERRSDIALLRLVATEAKVTAEDVQRFKLKLENDEVFRQLYIDQETEYQKSSNLVAENWLRLRMVSQFARAACTVGPPHDDMGRHPHQVDDDRMKIEYALSGPAFVEAIRTTRSFRPRPGPQYPETDIIELVANGDADQAACESFDQKVLSDEEFHTEVRERIRIYRTLGAVKSRRLQDALDGLDPEQRAKTDNRLPGKRLLNDDRLQLETGYQRDLTEPLKRDFTVRYRWPSLYRPRAAGPPSLPEEDRLSRLSRFQFMQAAFARHRLGVQGLCPSSEDLHRHHVGRLTEISYLEVWLRQAYLFTDHRWGGVDERAQGASSSRQAGPTRAGQSLAQGLQDLSISEFSQSLSRPARDAAASSDRGPSSRTSPRSYSDSRSSHAPAFRPATGQDNSPETQGSDDLAQAAEFSAYLGKDRELKTTRDCLGRYFLINTIAANSAIHGTSKQFQARYLAEPTFREACSQWLAFFRHCEYRPTWMQKRHTRLQEAIRRVTESRELPPAGPPLIRGDVALDEAEARDKFRAEEDAMRSQPAFLRPRRHAGVVYELRREGANYIHIKARWLETRQQLQQQQVQQQQGGGGSSRRQ